MPSCVPSRAVASLLLALCLALAPSGTLAAQANQNLPEAEAGETELAIAFSALDVELDPHHSIYSSEAQLFTGLYEGLFSYNPDTLDPVKAACSSFTKSKDGLTYTFYLRDNAIWSDGSPLLASDFRNAWLRAISPAEKADYASFFDVIAGAREFRLGTATSPDSVGISVIGDRVLQVKLQSPAAYFTRLLCHHSFSPIHPSMLKAKDWRARAPFPVNGAYQIASFGKDEIILEKNARYWDRDSVAVPKIRILLSDDDVGVTKAFDNGEIHWLEGPMDFDTLLNRDAIVQSPMFGTQYWFFDCASAPWNRAELRRALALLLPWKDIRASYTIPAPTLVLPYAGYQKAKGFEDANQAEAMALLERAGFPGGQGLPPLTILIPEAGEDASRVAGLMQAAWQKLPGFAVKVEKVSSTVYFQRIRRGPAKGGYTMGLTTWIGDFADPLAFLGMFTADSNLNDARYSDTEYERLLSEAAGKDGDARLDALANAETRLLSTAAVLPLYHNLAYNIIDRDYITGWYANALDIHPLKYLGFGVRSVRPNVALLW